MFYFLAIVCLQSNLIPPLRTSQLLAILPLVINIIRTMRFLSDEVISMFVSLEQGPSA